MVIKVMMMLMLAVGLSGYGLHESYESEWISDNNSSTMTPKLSPHINPTLLIFFISSFSVLDADIRITQMGLTMGRGCEGNPIAKIFTDKNDWATLHTIAYAAYTLGFVGMGAFVDALFFPYVGGIEAKFALQAFYTIAISLIDYYAINTWVVNRGLDVEFKLPIIYVTF